MKVDYEVIAVCADLGLVMKDDPAVRTVAKAVIQYARAFATPKRFVLGLG